MKAVLDRPWRFDFENKLALSVINLIDLNLVPQIRVSQNFEKTNPILIFFLADPHLRNGRKNRHLLLHVVGQRKFHGVAARKGVRARGKNRNQLPRGKLFQQQRRSDHHLRRECKYLFKNQGKGYF